MNKHHKSILFITLILVVSFSCISKYYNQENSFQPTLKQCFNASVYIAYLSVEYYKTRGIWPNTYSGLRLFATESDTLKKLLDSIPTDTKAYYQPITKDSTEIRINLKDKYDWKIFVTPRSIHQTDSTKIINNGKSNIIFKM